MDLNLLGLTFTALGEIIVAYTIISVHHRVMKEHKIDANVFKTMKKEQKIALVGILFIIVGYIINASQFLG